MLVKASGSVSWIPCRRVSLFSTAIINPLPPYKAVQRKEREIEGERERERERERKREKERKREREVKRER